MINEDVVELDNEPEPSRRRLVLISLAIAGLGRPVSPDQRALTEMLVDKIITSPPARDGRSGEPPLHTGAIQYKDDLGRRRNALHRCISFTSTGRACSFRRPGQLPSGPRTAGE